MLASSLFRAATARADAVWQADGHVDSDNGKMRGVSDNIREGRKDDQIQIGGVFQIADDRNPAGLAAVDTGNPCACPLRHGPLLPEPGAR